MVESQPLIHKSKTPFLDGPDAETKRRELLSYFQQTFDLYAELFSVIREEKSYFSRPEALRHPLIFYFGHTATFFVNKLVLINGFPGRINPMMEARFAVGVDEMSWDDLSENQDDWPSLAAVQNYRQEVRAKVSAFIESMPMTVPIKQSDPAWVILMGIEHERIHLETSSVIIRMLPIEEVRPDSRWLSCKTAGPAPKNELQLVSAKCVSLGKSEDDRTYGWDNEYGSNIRDVSEFWASKFLVSNGEYLEFVQAGGYDTKRFWCQEGERWVKSTATKLPKFWTFCDGKYFQRNLLEVIPLPLNWPVEVNHYEASAFCRWKSEHSGQSLRLPSEAEWRVLREKIPTDQPTWESAPGNINLEHYASSCPVDQFENGGFYDVIGNVWQWTDTAFSGFQGFAVHPIYDDFSVPTFDGKHMLIKGGSWISTGNESLKSARYAFRKHFFQHAGFRYVSGEQGAAAAEVTDAPYYESDEQISQYLEFHFGPEYFGVENFPVACVRTIIECCPDAGRERILDLGCAVGRASFEFSKYFRHVTAIDFSTRFIQNAIRLQQGESITFHIKTEGDLTEERLAQISSLYSADERSHIDFFQGDACNLKESVRDYDVIFAGNLLDRLYDPKVFLRSIADRLLPHGYLVLTSPYTWLTDYTAKENWLGGFMADGTAVTTLNNLKVQIAKDFVLETRRDLPFVIRETKRKYQHTVAEMTIWRKVR
jgi:5-histidylcysteine sulfoxide synthase/putative 4-mercaptohistidine N1-methyltranferase